MFTSIFRNAMSREILPKDALVPLLGHTLRFLRPSFLSSSHEPHVVRPTQFLDGMRGFACVIVFIWHAVDRLYPGATTGFQSFSSSSDNHYITQLPIIRIFYCGQPMVALFFVLSGFSITLKPLKFARQGASESLFNSLVSSTFRRASRLYLPSVILVILVLLQTYLGCFQYAEAMSETWPFLKYQVPPSLRMESGQFWHFCQALWQWSDPVCVSRNLKVV
jgi:peptidoglycan/LPS O-acetylase OafA/YrhL